MLRYFKQTVLVALVMMWLIPSVVLAELITDFSATYEVDQNGEVVVTETITYDFESATRRGIFRDIELNVAAPASTRWRERYTDFSLVSVTRDGQPEPYLVTPGNPTRIRLGDPDVTITGHYIY